MSNMWVPKYFWKNIGSYCGFYYKLGTYTYFLAGELSTPTMHLHIFHSAPHNNYISTQITQIVSQSLQPKLTLLLRQIFGPFSLTDILALIWIWFLLPWQTLGFCYLTDTWFLLPDRYLVSVTSHTWFLLLWQALGFCYPGRYWILCPDIHVAPFTLTYMWLLLPWHTCSSFCLDIHLSFCLDIHVAPFALTYM